MIKGVCSVKGPIVLLQRTAAAFKRDRRQMIRRVQRVALALFRIALFIGLSYVILYPILYMLSMTFRSDADSLDQSVVWLPKHFVTTNIRQAFISMDYLHAMSNPVCYSRIAALLLGAVPACVG